jgi:WD40 repeat protein
MWDTSEARRLALAALWRGPVARISPQPTDREDAYILSFSPDGRRLACTGLSGTVTLLNEDGHHARTLSVGRDTGAHRYLTWSDDSSLLAVEDPGDPFRVRVWSMLGDRARVFEAGSIDFFWFRDNELFTIERDPDRLLRHAYSRSFDTGDSTELATWRLPPETTVACGVDSRLRWLAYGRQGGSLFLRDLRAGHGQDVLVGKHASSDESSGVWCALEGPDQRMVSFGADGSIQIRATPTGELLHVRPMPDTYPKMPPILGGRDRFVAVASRPEKAVLFFDLQGPPDAGPVFVRRPDLSLEHSTVRFDPEGRWLAVGAVSSVTLFPTGLPRSSPLSGQKPPIARVVFTPDSRWLASCGDGARLWPLTAAGKRWRPIPAPDGKPYGCLEVAAEPNGEHLLVVAWPKVFLAPVNGGPSTDLMDVGDFPHESAALDETRRWAAVGTSAHVDPERRRLYVADRSSGEVRSYPIPSPDPKNMYGPRDLRFVGPDRLVAAGMHGIRIWNPATGTSRSLVETPGEMARIDTDASGRWLIAMVGAKGAPAAIDGRLELLDLQTGSRRPISTHGDRISAVAIDASGDVIASGDSEGTVRVGSASGDEPHLMLGGHTGPVRSIDISPDGRWLASVSEEDIRLWPMPDMSKPPFHTLPLNELVAKLHALTNLRVVEDEASPTGYRLDVGPFPGWRDVPTW